MVKAPVALIILDGWGVAPPGPGNAVEAAHTPTFDRLKTLFPYTTLNASGEAVGLPPGQIGNSEVGHLNIGAGRIVHQDLARIDRAVADGSLADNPVLRDACGRVNASSATLHIIGLCSRGGVHSQLEHILALVDAAIDNGVQRVRIHAITDGRDVSPDASLTDVPVLEQHVHDLRAARGADVAIATVTGRYWAMDRDRRWERTRRAYDAIVGGISAHSTATATNVVAASHAEGITDEFIEPVVLAGHENIGIAPADTVLWANFRPDRARQLSHALVDAEFDGFERVRPPIPDLVSMTRYEESLDVPVLFSQHKVDTPLAAVIAEAGLNQLHIAETEKYAHVTYFFNGGEEQPFAGEERILVDSPRDVATYDLKPQMSAEHVRDRFCEAMSSERFSFAVLNFANPDMVGHTGSIPAAISAVQTADACLAQCVEAIHARGGTCLVTADHGNAETMLTPEGKPHTAHTTNPVPFILAAAQQAPRHVLCEGGILGDIAPTVLALLGLDQPEQMTGGSLLVTPPADRS